MEGNEPIAAKEEKKESSDNSSSKDQDQAFSYAELEVTDLNASLKSEDRTESEHCSDIVPAAVEISKVPP